jgi:ribonuclease E
MSKRMLIDATHPEETRVAVVDGNRLEEFDYEAEFRKQLKGNIYLAKVTRVEPSLQAAFVEYGGNRHGFLPFPEIHQDYYRIPVGDRPEGSHHEDEDEEAGAEETGMPSSVMLAEYHADMISEAASDAASDAISEAFAQTAEEFVDVSGDSDAEAGAEAEPEHTEQHEAHAGDETGDSEETGEQSQGDSTGESSGAAGEAQPRPVPVETVGGEDEVEDLRHRRRVAAQHYKIQEVIKRRQIMLIQISKEERGNKGAAITTFLSLPGRYCVLMPNTPRGGGVSRKVANPRDRKRMKDLISGLELPDGMSVILRTAGAERAPAEIKRDLDYLLRVWENIRDLTMRSTAPALVYEEGNLVKRTIRDGFSREISEIVVAGEAGYRQAKDLMRMLMPSHARRVQYYRDPVPLFLRYQVETQIDAIHNPVAQLRSGGYVVINQTEALVSIDVNSGRSTRERNIEETAFKTNLEAADEIARQVRLRDMGGLIVIDFIDMEEPRHDAQVERRLKEAMRHDRARIQIGRMSPFGLLELSRQRLHPSLIESSSHTCAHCRGTGLVRSPESAAFVALRAIEEEGIKARAAEIAVFMPGAVALYVLNQKRMSLIAIEQRYGFKVLIQADDSLINPDIRIERLTPQVPGFTPPALLEKLPDIVDDIDDEAFPEEEPTTHDRNGRDRSERDEEFTGEEGDGEGRGRGRRRRRRRPRDGEEGEVRLEPAANDDSEAPALDRADQPDFTYPAEAIKPVAEEGERGRRRGRRGGRRRRGAGGEINGEDAPHHDNENSSEMMPQEERAYGGGFGGGFGSEPEAYPVLQPDFIGHGESETMAAEAPAEPAYAEAAPVEQPAPEPKPAPVKDYEKVNEAPPAPKGGWWKKLVQ